MGDRCYLSMRVHKDDIEKAAEFIAEKWGDGDTEKDLRDGYGDGPGTFIDEQANYGLSADRAELAELGVRFVGNHGSGCEYPACEFYSDGEILHEWDTDDHGGLSIPCGALASDDALQAAVRALKEFQAALDKMTDEVEKSWE